MNASRETTRTISGRWVVVVVFAFAILATGLMFVYWKFHVGPFLPLQKALAEEFAGSRPRVEGGQRKMHKESPRILRITMKVGFDPRRDTKTAVEFVDRVAEFVRGHFRQTDYEPRYRLDSYKEIELHLYHPLPEDRIVQQSFRRSPLPN